MWAEFGFTFVKKLVCDRAKKKYAINQPQIL